MLACTLVIVITKSKINHETSYRNSTNDVKFRPKLAQTFSQRNTWDTVLEGELDKGPKMVA